VLTMFKQFSKAKRELAIDSFENCQIALEFFIKDIKIRKESVTKYRLKTK